MVAYYRGVYPMIDKIDKEIIKKMRDGLRIPKIAQRLKISHQAIYKRLKKLELTRIITKGSKTSRGSSEGTPNLQPEVKGYIRLHGVEFNIKLFSIGSRYEKYKKDGHIYYDNNLIKFYLRSVEVYSGNYFYGDSPEEALNKAMLYFNGVFLKIERKFNIGIMRHGYFNVRMVNAHFSEVHNEIAIKLNINKDNLSIHTRKDNMLWAQVDNSLNLNEFECLHPDSNRSDMHKVVDYFNDIRDNEGNLKPSEVNIAIVKLTETLRLLTKNQVETSQILQKWTLASMELPKDKPIYIG